MPARPPRRGPAARCGPDPASHPRARRPEERRPVLRRFQLDPVLQQTALREHDAAVVPVVRRCAGQNTRADIDVRRAGAVEPPVDLARPVAAHEDPRVTLRALIEVPRGHAVHSHARAAAGQQHVGPAGAAPPGRPVRPPAPSAGDPRTARAHGGPGRRAWPVRAARPRRRARRWVPDPAGSSHGGSGPRHDAARADARQRSTPAATVPRCPPRAPRRTPSRREGEHLDVDRG